MPKHFQIKQEKWTDNVLIAFHCFIMEPDKPWIKQCKYIDSI